MANRRMLTAVVAAAAALLPAAGVPRTAAAAEFGDACVAAGAGMFEPKDCTCIEGKVSGDDRGAMMAFFKANIEAAKGGPKPDENNPELQKGFLALNNYLGQCMK